MTTAVSLKTIRHELYNQIPGLGLAGVASGVAATSVTDPYIFGDTTVGQNHFRGFYIYRPDLTGDDRVKKANTVNTTTGALSHAGTEYSNTTDPDYELIGLMHPDELDACIRRAMTRIYYEIQVPLPGELTDGDMDDSTVDHWTSNSLATHAKTSTASKVYSGVYSLHTVTDAAGEYTESVSIRVFPNTLFYASTVVHADSGTAVFQVYDKSNGAVIGSAVTSGEEGWAHLWIRGTFPAGCELAALRLGGQESGADLYWNHALLYPRDKLLLPAPAWLDAPFKFLKLREATYNRQLSAQNSGGYDDAQSRSFKDWYQPQMFSLDPLHLDSNPYTVQLMRMLPENELWVQGKRPFSDVEPLSSEESTTRAPIRQVYAYAKEEIAKVLRKRYPNDARWNILQLEALQEIDAETQARPEIPLQPLKHEYMGRV